MDFSRVLGAQFRVVRDTEHDGQPARAIEGSRLYATRPEDLWDAVTSIERLPRWFLPITGDLQLGGRFQLEGNAEGTIVRCDPPEVFEVTWEFGGGISWVSVRLAAEKGGTRLTLVHTSLKDEASEAHWATYGPGAVGVGWDGTLLGLGWYLDSEAGTFEREAAEAWMFSEPGKDFMRACAEAWGRAHDESGEDAAVATAMAEKTAAFYTGG